VFYYSCDRAGEHPQVRLGGNAGSVLEAACWVHARRPLFVMADLVENARHKVQGQNVRAMTITK
jgi:hypothetical protein